MLFFCCHKCHTRTKIVEKKSEKFTGESDEKRVFPCCVLRVSRNWIDEILNYVFRIPAEGCNRVFYEKMCDTCDSKNNKTPCNARVRVSARRVIIGIFTILKSLSLVLGSLCSVAPSEGGIKKNSLFLWKQAVVFMKTSRRFCENKPLFLWKPAVVFVKTSRRFCENEPSFLWKPAVAFVKTSRRLGMSVVLFCRKSFSDFLGKAIKRLNRLAIQSIVYCRWRRERQAVCSEKK